MVTQTSITIEWSPVPCLQQNIELIEYRIHTGLSENYPSPTRTRVSQDGRTLTESNLNSATSYFFVVYSVRVDFVQGGSAPQSMSVLFLVSNGHCMNDKWAIGSTMLPDHWIYPEFRISLDFSVGTCSFLRKNFEPTQIFCFFIKWPGNTGISQRNV